MANHPNRSKLAKMLRPGNRGDIAKLSEAGYCEAMQDGDATQLWRRLERAGYVYLAGDRHFLGKNIGDF